MMNMSVYILSVHMIANLWKLECVTGDHLKMAQYHELKLLLYTKYAIFFWLCLATHLLMSSESCPKINSALQLKDTLIYSQYVQYNSRHPLQCNALQCFQLHIGKENLSQKEGQQPLLETTPKAEVGQEKADDGW